MNPIISPWVFYVIDIMQSLSNLATVLTIVTVVVCGAAVLALPIISDAIDDDVLEWIRNNAIKKFIVFCIVLLFIDIFVPSKQTAYTMLIAQYTTTDNIEKVGGTAEKAVQKLADIIIKTANEMEKKE